MTTKRIPLAEATRAQLAQFAQLNLGIDVHPNWNANTLRGQIGPAWGKDYIEIEDDDGPVPLQKAEGYVKPELPPSGRKRRMALIQISETEAPGGTQPVPVSVNGKAMYIERGKPQEIPYEYYEALLNAVQFQYIPAKPGNMLQVFEEVREVPRHPVSLLRLDPEPAQAA